MWANRITLDYIKHNDAKNKLIEILKEKNFNDDCITDLHISCDAGYVYYKVIFSDKSSVKIFDDGSEIK